MASFYNNYYRYYRPYSPNISNNYSASHYSTNKAELLNSYNNNSYSNPNKQAYEQLSNKEKKSSKYCSSPFSNIEEPLFEVLGIKLYLDDIIIICLLFFLYQEGVQDEMLYISLILLLLS
jgi:hypothetical protein